jgi:protein phosphatase
MGGHLAGEVASNMAIQTLVQTVVSHIADANGGRFDPVDALEEGFRRSNRAIYEQGESDPDTRGMGTTLTAAITYAGRLYVGHVGDSRAYLLRSNRIARLSRDHTLVQHKVDAGLMTEEQAMYSEERNQLCRVLGIGTSVECDIATEHVQDGDLVLLCTDGLHNSVGPSEMAATAAQNPSPQRLCEDLVARALARDGSDNVTAVCIAVPPERDSRTRPRAARRPIPRRQRLLALLLLLVSLCMGMTVRMIVNSRRQPENQAVETKHLKASASSVNGNQVGSDQNAQPAHEARRSRRYRRSGRMEKHTEKQTSHSHVHGPERRTVGQNEGAKAEQHGRASGKPAPTPTDGDKNPKTAPSETWIQILGNTEGPQNKEGGGGLRLDSPEPRGEGGK